MIIDEAIQQQVFTSARTFNKFTDQAVSDETLRQLYDLMRWGPTSMNTQPARYVFLRTHESRQRLFPALSPGNQAKTLAAPVTVIVAMDTRFFDQLPTQFPSYDAKPMFEGNAALAQGTAFRNSTLQGAYLIIAARMLGLDCGPMSGFDADMVNAEFFPDGQLKANFLINMGYGDASGNHPRGPRLPFETVAQLL
ncbi:MAG: malonic semialdehyde reductase [Formivibrio sp.]|nr:malonic semialdehyde reductase [Formivibrio sp.]